MSREPGERASPEGGLTLPTSVARSGWYDHRFLGHWAFGDLSGRESLAGLCALAITGRRLTDDERGVCEDYASSTLVADPRIWPLKVPRVVSAYGGLLPALSAAYLYFDGAMIGPWLAGPCATFYRELRSALGESADDPRALEAELLRRLPHTRRVPGFGVPFRDHDERLVFFRACLDRRARLQMPYWRMFENMSVILRRVRQIEPSMVGASAAAFLDMGMEPDQIAMLCTFLVSPNFLANAVEGARQAPAMLQRLPLDRVRYAGPAPRESPRAAARKQQP